MSMQHMPHIPKENQMEIENIIAAVFLEWSREEVYFLLKIIDYYWWFIVLSLSLWS